MKEYELFPSNQLIKVNYYYFQYLCFRLTLIVKMNENVILNHLQPKNECVIFKQHDNSLMVKLKDWKVEQLFFLEIK